MTTRSSFEFPDQQRAALKKARRLEWIGIFYLLSVVVLMYLVQGNSQAMKTAWLEDLLSLVPPIVFLIASRIALRPPTERFPYGHHRAVSIAFLCGSLALFAMGAWLLGDAVVKLVKTEHTTIGGIHLFGHTFWLGWLMLPTLVWSALPAVLLGRLKLPLAKKIHDKVLFADSQMNKADWMTAAAAMVGVVGVGLGFWWADAAAAACISFSILRDGFTNLLQVVKDLMDEVPWKVDRSGPDPFPRRVAEYLLSLPWVAEAQVRMREEGHVYFGEAFVVPSDENHLSQRLERAARDCQQLNWRLHDFVLVPVTSLPRQEQPTP